VTSAAEQFPSIQIDPAAGAADLSPVIDENIEGRRMVTAETPRGHRASLAKPPAPDRALIPDSALGAMAI
jgi:hypothetical protein